MSIGIRQIIDPPVFEDDEEKTRSARLLNAILLADLAILVVSGLVTPIIRGSLNGILHTSIIILLLLGVLWLMRLGHVRLASGLLSLSMWGAATALLLLSGSRGRSDDAYSM